MSTDPFASKRMLTSGENEKTIYSLRALADAGVGDIATLPISIKVLLESVLRNCDGHAVTEESVKALAAYDAASIGTTEIPFKPGRVVLQDFTGVPAVVDLAAMRAAIVRMTGSDDAAEMVNPLIPCDLVIDHSVQVDAFGDAEALQKNSDREFERNHERYQFLKWGQQAFSNFQVVPPGNGIVHQVNLERLARVVWEQDDVLFPDTLVGTDSHTTMINGAGVLGWGVGGIEAEAAMLGQPVYMLIPEVVGVELTGELPAGTTTTDLVLRITEVLREHGVVGKFVEFFGAGARALGLADRATIANMAPEYGATMGFFPVDGATIDFLRQSARDEELIATVEAYTREQGMWAPQSAAESDAIRYGARVQLDMATVVPSMAGPKRPQDRIALSDMNTAWQKTLSQGFSVPQTRGVEVENDGDKFTLNDGAVVIAAITSCTNTSNPQVMVAAGLVAQKAAALGLRRKPWVKTSLAPGSQVVSAYLDAAGLTDSLSALGFDTVGYGCTTCIGNSGPLPAPISAAINDNDLVACSVLSGNRNFEGRIGPDIRANYLASPPLVVAYAICGTIAIDLEKEPLAKDKDGNEVFLRDLWPSANEVADVVASSLRPEHFSERYAEVFTGSNLWQQVDSPTGPLYRWDEHSTYVQEPPFFTSLTTDESRIEPIHRARVLAKLGDSITTDHISPAGAIGPDSPAGIYLRQRNVSPEEFNSYGSRRGNDRVMTRGTFANVRVRNQLAPEHEGGYTLDYNIGEITPIHNAGQAYQDAQIPTVVLAGRDYGMGSSRDWAAKGTYLLGVRAVIAVSYERIHRSNLVGMGVLPLCFKDGDDADSLGLTGSECFEVVINDDLQPRQDVEITATAKDGSVTKFMTTCRIDTPVEIEYYRDGGILHSVLKRMARKHAGQ